MTQGAAKHSHTSLPRGLRLALAVMVAAVCVWGMLNAWQAGASRLLTHHAKTAGLLAQADDAVGRTPLDPEAHSGRALVLLNQRELDGAIREYERAVALRPRDYLLWLELGRARDKADDEAGALLALEQSVKLAPAYAQPRWHYGNVLFRASRAEESFSELRRAAAGDPGLLSNVIDLAWNASGADPLMTEQLIQPESSSWRLALAQYFVKRGRAAEALTQFRAAAGVTEDDRRVFVKELLDAGSYREAYEVWAGGEGGARRGMAMVSDGGFERRMSRDDAGFDWRLMRDAAAVRISLDGNNPRSGAQSLRVNFGGDPNPSQPIITQLVLVEPNTRYRLRFSARMEELVTGGPPLVGVSDAGGAGNGPVAQSSPLTQDAVGWREYTVEFTTPRTASAVLVTLSRENCGGGQCPIFGHLWLDDFEIQKIDE